MKTTVACGVGALFLGALLTVASGPGYGGLLLAGLFLILVGAAVLLLVLRRSGKRLRPRRGSRLHRSRQDAIDDGTLVVDERSRMQRLIRRRGSRPNRR
jgi:hypothetical protein